MARHYKLQTPAPGPRRRYDSELNPQQLEVVTTGPGPVLVLAGAGSGKTRTVTYRVAWLIEQGLAPESLLLLTYTNKASQEMLRRVEALVTLDPRRLWGGTFHRVANLVLRRHAPDLGLTANYSILDREDAKDIISQAIDDLNLPQRETRFPRAEVVASVLSFAANTERPLPDVLLEKLPMFCDECEIFAKLAERYAVLKREANAMDYDDLLLGLRRLLEDDEDLRDHYARRFEHILVDEYQDTNAIQARIIDLLAAKHRNVMVVGDDAQSIYSFRGAVYANILNFPERYADARVLKLETNYRSSPEILAVANRIIAANVDQFVKTLVAVRPPLGKPALVPVQDGAREAAFVGQRILELRDEGIPLTEVAVLYRSHWHSLEVQMELSRRRIPYEVRSGIRFFESAHVKDVLAHLRVVVNPSDELAWKRVLKMLPKIGGKTAENLTRMLRSTADPLAAMVNGHIDAKVPKGAQHAFKKLQATLSELSSEAVRPKAGEMVRTVLRGEYVSYLYENYDDAERRIEELDALALFAINFATPETFLTELALTTNVESEHVVAGGDEDERVVLSTVHQAKGLEWRAVFVIGLTEGRFPSARSLRHPGGEAEERRLFYVAATRAKDELYLLHAQVGYDEARRIVLLQPSRFLGEIGTDVVEPWMVEEERLTYETEPGQGRFFYDDDYPQ